MKSLDCNIHWIATTNGWIKTQGSESGLTKRTYKVIKSGSWINQDLVKTPEVFRWQDMDQYEIAVPEFFE